MRGKDGVRIIPENKGRSIPGGWGMDDNGQVTMDPGKVEKTVREVKNIFNASISKN